MIGSAMEVHACMAELKLNKGQEHFPTMVAEPIRLVKNQESKPLAHMGPAHYRHCSLCCDPSINIGSNDLQQIYPHCI